MLDSGMLNRLLFVHIVTTVLHYIPGCPLPGWHVVGPLRRPVGIESLMMRCGEASARERTRGWRCCLVMGRVADACPCSGGWVQMVMVVKKLTAWPGYVASCCGSGRSSQAKTCRCTRGACRQAGTRRSRGSSPAVNKPRVATCGTGEGLVVPRHHVAVYTTRGIHRASRHQLVLWVSTGTLNAPPLEFVLHTSEISTDFFL
jgi:hypothetical protein